MRADRRFLWFWLSVATTLSVGGNVGHAWLTVGAGPSRWMAIAWAVAPPALLMLAIHGLPTLSRMLGSDERDRLLTGVVWGVTVGAFGWSAVGIFGFTDAMGVPARMAWVAPLVIDLSVFGATRGLVLTAPLAARMKLGVAPTRGRSLPVAGAPGEESLSHQPRAHEPGDLVAPPAAADAAAQDTRSVQNVTGHAPVGAGAAATRPYVAPDTLELAEQIVASGAVRKPVETVAAILSAAQGESRKAAIADHIGVHHSVVTKTLDAAESQRRHRLSAV